MQQIATKLVGAQGLEVFNAEVRESRAAQYPAALTSAETAALLDLARLERLLADPAVPVEQIDIYADAHLVRLADILHRSGRSALDIAAEQLRGGSTLRFRDCDRSDTRLADLAAAVAEQYAAQAQINAYLTPPHRNGFPPHFDNTDVFIVQLAGAKTWQLYPEYTNRVALPDPETPWDPKMYQPSGPADIFEMRPGDVLYIPRGGMHSARCFDEESLHLTISLSSLSMVTLLERELRHLANRNEALRRRVTWTLAGDPAETEAVRQTLRGWLRVFSEELDPARVINETREQLKRQEPGPANLLSEAIAGLRGQARKGEK